VQQGARAEAGAGPSRSVCAHPDRATGAQVALETLLGVAMDAGGVTGARTSSPTSCLVSRRARAPDPSGRRTCPASSPTRERA
jgi:hypothetical protein